MMNASARRAAPRRHLQLWTVVLVATAFVATLLTAGADVARAAPTLLSQGRPATASSAENGTFAASAAVDGNAGTRWSSAFSDPQWIQVDLGASVALTRVVLNWETAYSRAFTIQTSANGSTWTTVHTTTTGTGGTQNLPVTGTGRYVRLHSTQRATVWGVSLWEFQVFGDTGTTPPGDVRLLSYAKPGVASSSQNDGACFGCSPDKAFDTDPATRWATSPTGGWVDPG